jgi:hypothetical protein
MSGNIASAIPPPAAAFHQQPKPRPQRPIEPTINESDVIERRGAAWLFRRHRVTSFGLRYPSYT